MKFSIITPSFRNSEWLKLCVASVADQEGVEHEHIVQDAVSDDGTLEWLTSDSRVQAIVEKDKGMYDAVNRGIKRSNGDLIAYLNCDEQYVPGALKAVHDFFEAHPEIDAVFSDTVVVESDGSYVCHRLAQVPFKNLLWFRMPVITCSMFMRRRIFEEMNIYFDTQWRDSGDVFWLTDVVNRGVKMAALRQFTSVFTETGENRNIFNPNALREREIQQRMIPPMVKAAGPLFVIAHHLRSIASGMYWQKPFSYEIYVQGKDGRKHFEVVAPTAVWRGRTAPANGEM